MANRYNISFNNQVGDDIQILIEPKQEYDLIGNPIPIGPTIYLTAVAGSYFLTSNTNDDDKTYCGILTKELQFGYVFTPENNVGIETFVKDDFDFWKVTLRVNNQIQFVGRLTMDASQKMMNRPEDVILRAVDGTTVLKSFQQYNLKEKNTVLFHIVQAMGHLEAHELRLRTLFNVTNTLMPGRTADPSFDPLDNIWIEDKLFDGMNCHDALTLILKNFRCRLYQENGYWWIEHIGERLNIDQFAWSEYQITSPVFPETIYTYEQTDNKITQDIRCEIGTGKSVKVVNADAIKYVQLPKKYVELSFDYKQPRELFCNQLFDQLRIPISSSPTENTFYIDCWEHQKSGSLLDPEEPVNLAYIIQEMDEFSGTEKARTAILPTEAANAGSASLMSPYFEVSDNDRIRVSITSKIKNGYTADGSSIVAYLVLFGDSGTNYFCGYNSSHPDSWNGTWYVTNAGLSINGKAIIEYFPPDSDQGEQITTTVTTKHIPERGRCRIWLRERSGDNYPNETQYKEVRIEISTYLGSSEYTAVGDTNTQTDASNSIDSIQETVEISDTPNNNINILGGLYRGPDVDVEMRELYPKQWDYFGNFVTFRRFSELMSGVIHSHTRRSLIKIETSFKSYAFISNFTTYQTGFLPRYQFTDFSPVKEFMLTGTYEADLTTGICRAVFVETLADKLSGENGNSDYYEFQYITE